MQSKFLINSKSQIFKIDLNSNQRKWEKVNISGIEIEIESLSLQGPKQHIVMERPIAVRGVILPCETKGRKAPPNPAAFDFFGKYIRSVTQQKRFRLISPHSDRGHIFALELGGPNCKYNIMPQWSGFQEHGDWRRLEKALKINATTLLKNNNSLFLEVNIEYINLNIRDLQEQFEKIFDFQSLDKFTEDNVKKCLQVFGIPVSYSFDSYPCNVYIKKPRNHSLSISYIKYLYEIAVIVYQDDRQILEQTKIKMAQKKLNKGWGMKLSATNFINCDKHLFKNLNNFCLQGTFAFSNITEEDL